MNSLHTNKMANLNDYRMKGTLGGGNFGKVKRKIHLVAEHKHTKQCVAIKILSRLKLEKYGLIDTVRREIRILKTFQHPHVIRL